MNNLRMHLRKHKKGGCGEDLWELTQNNWLPGPCVSPSRQWPPQLQVRGRLVVCSLASVEGENIHKRISGFSIFRPEMVKESKKNKDVINRAQLA